MQLFDQGFCQRTFCLINDQVNTSEMVYCLQNIIYVYRAVRCIDGISFKYIPGLVMCQSTAFHVVGIVCQLDLHFMIDTPGYSVFLLHDQSSGQILRRFSPPRFSAGFLCCIGNIPGLSRYKSAGNTSVSAVLTYYPLSDPPFFTCSFY